MSNAYSRRIQCDTTPCHLSNVLCTVVFSVCHPSLFLYLFICIIKFMGVWDKTPNIYSSVLLTENSTFIATLKQEKMFFAVLKMALISITRCQEVTMHLYIYQQACFNLKFRKICMAVINNVVNDPFLHLQIPSYFIS